MFSFKIGGLKVEDAFGLLGFVTLVAVAIYLILKKLGLFHSPEADDVLLTVVIGQVFYNGYVYRAVQEIKEIRRELKEIKERM